MIRFRKTPSSPKTTAQSSPSVPASLLSQWQRAALVVGTTLLLSNGAWAQKVPGARSLPEGYLGDKKLYYGAAYYPEAWDAALIDEDIKKMKALNMNVMRIAEFSWSTMEPTEGQYNFGWLHSVIEKLNAAGIQVILGTPSATPPNWLISKYPDMMLTYPSGVQEVVGKRRDCSYANENYRRECTRITERMAQEFGKKAGVIGWQTDNEMSLTYDYSTETKGKWHKWLAARYGTLANLNNKWALALWSQSFNDWTQVPMPEIQKWQHPSLEMAWVEFWNQQVISFQDLQVAAIRKHSTAPITHDGMPGQTIDYPGLFKDLDYMAINNYHSFEAYDLIQSNYDRMRGYGKGMHWLFETAPNYSGGGNNGQTWYLHMPEGSMRAALWMNYAMGAQGSMFWLWRQQPAGQEMTHGAVLQAWGAPSANYKDLEALGAELKKVSQELMYRPVAPAQMAIMWDHKAKAGLEIEESANGIKYYQDWTYRFYQPVAQQYWHRDVIAPGNDLSQYKVIFIPLMPSMDANLQARLKAWVTAGGRLILGPMTGYRDDEWCAFRTAGMGALESWTGIQVESHIPIGTKQRPAEIEQKLRFAESLGINEYKGELWGLSLLSTKGNALATWQNGMLKDRPAIMENTVGKGKVMVLGTDPGTAAIQALVSRYAKEAGLKPEATGDAGVVVVPRAGKVGKAAAVVNISATSKTITLPSKGKDLLTGQNVEATQVLKPYEVRLVTQD